MGKFKKLTKKQFKELKADFLKTELKITEDEYERNSEEYKERVRDVQSYFKTIHDVHDLAGYLCEQGADLAEAYEIILNNIFK